MDFVWVLVEEYSDGSAPADLLRVYTDEGRARDDL